MNTTHAMEQVDDGQHTQEGVSTERAFEADPIPSLSETITARAIAASFILGVALCAVAMKISLNSGFLPSLTVPAGLVGFYLVRAWIRALDCCFQVPHQLPFTRQENTVIQTCVVACSAITFSGGFGTYILAMGKNAAGGDVRDGKNIVEPSIGRTVAFLFLVSFSGMFVLMPFRKVMIIRHRLTYPNGMATAHLINSFHTPQGASKARQQVEMLFRSLGGTMLWNMFQWFFAAAKGCGFGVFPIFGLEAYKHGFYFDFSMSNIGIGMLCPYTITVSMFIGSVVSWGLVSPYLATKAGVWYSSHLSPSSLSGIRGYKVFIGVSMILADGLFNFLSITVPLPADAARARRPHLPRRAGRRVLRRVRLRRDGHEPVEHLRQARHGARGLQRGAQRRRRRRRPRGLWDRDGDHVQRQQPDAGPQDGVPDADLAAHRVHQPGHRHGARVRRQPGHVLGLLQGGAERRHRRLRRALRPSVPQHRHAERRAGRDTHAQPLALQALLRAGARAQRVQGGGHVEALACGTLHSEHHLCGHRLCGAGAHTHRHVRRELGAVPVEACRP
ncbi:putative metal-nicotianamine transporter YSL7 [Zea mays]|uniref:Putative metal-nicotianamine transporter YSL7 n=1 Tax=Zea mays TaxID=4577 RepID=A0A1D6QUQ0_MAIZE|nr:putative metal-nicotianamine transporter YSL7 [Zea mays]